MNRLYTYFRSSAAYRVRIALALKGLPYQSVPVHLVRNGGEQLRDDYRQLNPGATVPLWIDREQIVPQSLAIIEYLDEIQPVPPLLPADAAGRARVRALALDIACDIHPLNNLRVLKYLVHTLGITEAQKLAWYRHWVEQGLATVEARLAASGHAGDFCDGEAPTLADCCLIPQVANGRRFDCRLDDFPNVLRIDAVCRALPAFQSAAPENQPDAE